MNELITLLGLGFFDAINDINNNGLKVHIIIDDNLKSKIYDFGYLVGYNSYNEYQKKL